MNTNWRDDAACREIGPDLFFPEKGDTAREGRSICAGCPVRTECLTFALDHNERHGVWGGLVAQERKSVKVHDDAFDTDVAHFTSLGLSIPKIAERLGASRRRVERARQRNRLAADQAERDRGHRERAAARPHGAAA